MERHKFKGLSTGVNIETDEFIEEICKQANQSSNMARSILYTIFIVSVLAFVAYWNSRLNDWLELRIKNTRGRENMLLGILSDSSSQTNDLKNKYSQFHDNKDLLLNDTICLKKPEHSNTNSGRITEMGDSDVLFIYNKNSFLDLSGNMTAEMNLLKIKYSNISHEANELHATHEKFDGISADNRYRIHIPVLGISADINDLGLLSGVTFSILLFILIFTLNREFSNLKLAFISITRRYTDDAELEHFLPVYKGFPGRNPQPISFPKEETEEYYKFLKEDTDFREFVREVNFIRRQYHYNFLSMNEIFTLPDLGLEIKRSPVWQYSTYLILLPPLLMQGVICCYDWITSDVGNAISPPATTQTLWLDVVFFIIIGFITVSSIQKKYQFGQLWADFYNKGYKLERNWPLENISNKEK